MEILSGLIGAIIGAAVALLTTLLTLRNKRQEERNKRQEDRRKMNEAAAKTLAETSSFLSELGEYLEYGPPLDNGTIEELKKERKLVRANLMWLRQVYPEPDVRHDAERLSDEIDKSFIFLEPDPGEEERQWAIVTQARRDASETAETVMRRIRRDMGEEDRTYIASQGAG